MTPRAQYIRDHYSLSCNNEEWIARSEHGGVDSQTGKPWSVNEVISGSSKAEVCRKARANWGHFNFEDEAKTFSEIFPR